MREKEEVFELERQVNAYKLKCRHLEDANRRLRRELDEVRGYQKQRE